MANRVLVIALLLSIVASALLSTACKRNRTAPTLSAEEIQELTKDQPDIFIKRDGSLTMEGVENLYLGQSYDDAMEVLDDYCEVIKVFEGGWRHSHAVFKGCIIGSGPEAKTIRAGFWPFNEDRLSTLEIQSRPIPQPVVRARFTEIADELKEDLPRRGLLVMASSRYRLLANWDDGVDEPAHITIGFHPP